MKTNILIFGSIFLIIFLNSCKKEGPQGPPGRDGNANVTSLTFTIDENSWVSGSNIWYKDISVNKITPSVIQNGLVKVFMESSVQTDVWLNLPWLEVYDGYTSIFNFNCGVGTVRIFKIDTDGLLPSNPGTRKFKIVVVDGMAFTTKPNIDYNDFKEIRKNFNITEIN